MGLFGCMGFGEDLRGEEGVYDRLGHERGERRERESFVYIICGGGGCVDINLINLS